MGKTTTMADRGGGVLFVLIDGLADVSLRQLKEKTPLQSAKTPALDAVACTRHALFYGRIARNGD